MADLNWLKIPGDQLYTSLTKGNQLDSRVTILENNGTPTPVTVEQMEQTVESLVASVSPPAFVAKGYYSATASYSKLDVVIGSDGNTYECVSPDPVTGVDPIVDTSVWTILIKRGETGATGLTGLTGQPGAPGQNAVANIAPKGNYSNTATYTKNDTVVGVDKNSYLCLITGTKGINPVTDTTGAWCLFVMQGPKGDQGLPGKDAPTASITAANLSPALASQISAANALVAGSSEGSWGTIDTGKSFRGKKVFRIDATLYVNASANTSVDFTLDPTPNMVDHIISVGGDWQIGFGKETKCIPNNDNNQNTSEVLLFGDNALLTFRSKANNARSGHLAVIIVEFTKK